LANVQSDVSRLLLPVARLKGARLVSPRCTFPPLVGQASWGRGSGMCLALRGGGAGGSTANTCGCGASVEGRAIDGKRSMKLVCLRLKGGGRVPASMQRARRREAKEQV